MPWQPFVGITLLGLSFGWRVAVGPGGVSVARTLWGIPLRFYRLGGVFRLQSMMGFDEGSDTIEIRVGDKTIEMGSLRGQVAEGVYNQIVEGVERAGLQTARLTPSGTELRVFQPRSAPTTF